jgi:GTP:adenosylcobinamide-phosphate guanylyltransferase
LDALILAGGIPQPNEPLYNYTRGIPKAMLEIAGKPMIQWVLDALSEVKSIDNVVITGLSEDTRLTCGKKVYFVVNQAGMVDNLRAGAKKIREISPVSKYALIVSSDIPAIKSEMVEWIINSTREKDRDIFYNIISRDIMEKRFPNAHRTYLHLKKLVFCSGDAHVASLKVLLQEDIGIWRKITDARKSPLKQAALIGFDTVLLYLLKLLSIKQAEKIITKRLKIPGEVVLCPFAEIGMDVDKPRHLEIMRDDLSKHYI